MALADYNDLTTEIANWVDMPTSQLTEADYITLAEADIKADLDLFETQGIETADLSTSSHYLALPDYFSSPIRMHINVTDSNGNVTQYPVTFTTADGLNKFYTTNTERPRYVAVIDGQFEFNCTPDDTYEVELLFNKLTTLDGTTLTNEIFPTFLNCYLYGALKHAAIYLKDDHTEYERQYEIFIKKIIKKNKRKKFPHPLRPNTRYSK